MIKKKKSDETWSRMIRPAPAKAAAESAATVPTTPTAALINNP